MTAKPGKRRRRQAPVTITRPGAESEVVAASTIRRRARQVGAGTVELGDEQLRELVAGRSPRIIVAADCKLGPGDTWDVPGHPGLWLGVTGTEDTEIGLELLYVRYDDQPPRLLRARPHAQDFDAIRRSYDDRGLPMPLTDEGSVEAAAEESGYTSSPGAALSREPEAISREAHEAMMRTEQEEREERIRHKIRRAHEAIAELDEDDDFKGAASSLRFLKGLVLKLERELLAEQRKDQQR